MSEKKTLLLMNCFAYCVLQLGAHTTRPDTTPRSPHRSPHSCIVLELAGEGGMATNGWVDWWMGGLVAGWVDGRMGGWVARWVDGWMVGVGKCAGVCGWKE